MIIRKWKKNFLHKFKAQNIKPISTRGNGNCLYNAISTFQQTLSPECEFGWGDDLNIIGLSILIQRPIYILNSHYNASFYSNYTNSKKSPIVIIHKDQHFTGTLHIKNKSISIECPETCVDKEIF